ncbi:MAG: L-2-hydroxyglutarate oxidase [Bacteroidota bacterium]
MENKYDILIIGAGIVGLATAYKLLEKNKKLKIAVLDKEASIGKHQTGNNSGVIHSGIYYKPEGLRAKNNREGYKMLIDFCQKEDIKYEITGKIIVATEQHQLPTLDVILDRGVKNGLDGLKLLDIQQLREIEPHVGGIKGIWVPQSGIVDFPGVTRAYAKNIQEWGASIFLNEKVIKIENKGDACHVITENRTFSASLMVNCAGLYSDKLASQTHNTDIGMQILPFRGEYYKLRKEREYLVKNLIYPAPDPAFPWLGVHFTRMIKGGIEAGPNAVLAFRREGYKKLDIHLGELFETLTYPGFRKMATKFWRQGLDEYKRSFYKPAFTSALQKLLPELVEDDLVEGGAGVRALACGKDGALLDDYLFFDDKNVINVCNAPSPAATSSLSIGNHISDMILKKI